MSNVTEEARRGDDWKQWKTGWKYKKDAPVDKQWQKDRDKLFRRNGNGWWWFKMKRKIDWVTDERKSNS